ncbi:hypothetical protein CYMTET_12481 [Cymbomonas tetramitiformis]|uniref:Secreted protein n=1 Tax=Cymbomonas tetramitiformis TaxID=36881 RepID=A0AAE0GKE6_9CHLO|nr:hypothetical protein CYMTET_12481 [Cymbomonas tetramitiformis]
MLVLTVAVAGVVVGGTVGGSGVAPRRVTDHGQGTAADIHCGWHAWGLVVPRHVPLLQNWHAISPVFSCHCVKERFSDREERGGVGVGAAAAANLPVVGLDRVDASGSEDAHEEDHESRSELAYGTEGAAVLHDGSVGVEMLDGVVLCRVAGWGCDTAAAWRLWQKTQLPLGPPTLSLHTSVTTRDVGIAGSVLKDDVDAWPARARTVASGG